MTNKIVILENSVELYEHYMGDEKWERTLAFPRGGVTYLVSNGTIKFFAFEDYLYRNCIISMQLPIYVVDEKRHIDGEYDNINDLVRVLDPIFPSNDIDAELAFYLTIADAERLYQPIGDYALRSEIPDVSDLVTDEELVEALEDYYTKNEADARFQPIGDYVEEDDFNTYTADTAAVIDELDNRKADLSALTPYFDDAAYDSVSKKIKFFHDGVLKAQIDATPFIKDGMVNNVVLENGYLIITFNTDAGKEPIAIELDGMFDPTNYYTKDEADSLFQPIGNYVNLNEYNTYTSTTNTTINNLKNDKLDASAYTPCDLSNYYTKNEVYNKTETYNRNEIDDKISQSGTFDPTRYYTKDVSDSRYALKNEIPSLSGYATEQWVINKNYATRADFITYINNMQTQINSLIEAVSGCCETQEDVYRWLTIIGEYLCENNNKYEKQKYQVSHDGGIVWEDVSPIQYQKGQLLESDSEDCGYVPDPQYRWKAAPTSDYLCSGTSKYYKVYYEVSYDGGQTWQHAVPEQTKRGNLIEANSADCGYIAPQYRWKDAANSDYMCSGTTKYKKQYYQVSTDGGTTWQNVSPEQTRRGSVIEYNSTDCGYIAPQYRWYTSQSEYLCSGTTKCQKQYYQVSYNGGSTWQNVSPTQTRTGSVIETNSTDCGYIPPVPKYQLTLKNGSVVSAACDSTSSLKQSEIEQYSANTVSAIIGECVSVIDKWAFWVFNSLTSVTIPTSVITINTYAFGACHALSSVIIPNSVITIGSSAFAYCDALTSVTIPNSVTTIGSSAFYDCSGIRTLTIGNSVTSIGDSAFNLCVGLTTVTLPSSVTSLGTGAFNQCHGLTSVVSRATTPPTMGTAVFDETNLTSIRVPSGSVNAYKAADGWKKYANIITAI